MVDSLRAKMAYPDEKRMTLRYPGMLQDQLTELARRDHRSVNGEIVWLLMVAIEWRSAWSRARQRVTEAGPVDEGGLVGTRGFDPDENVPHRSSRSISE